eukprot:TRINITY_DN1866_c0_g1_i4.p1 TRINITY_DN1866_c0_g1~~TRINITY_DN1866_c0_g1_i4.p1  ORF type:complete len:304 (-),score=55.17 TRINITY_DN1866_c0_g1_i4:134-1045(-)
MSGADGTLTDCLVQACWVGIKMLFKQLAGQHNIKHGASPEKIAASAQGQAPVNTGTTQAHIIICSLDYPGTGNELTCTKDGDNMQILVDACGVQDVNVLYNNDAHKANVIDAIQRVGRACNPGDYFIFYYSGHGTSVPDKDGDEADGKDEAFCLVTEDGKIDWNAFMTDDEFSTEVTSSVSDDVNIIVLADCCHSGTVSDFTSEVWNGKNAISISGCTDAQTSGDTGNGGIFTHSMLMALQELTANGDNDFSVGKLYNRTVKKDDKIFNSKQEISIAWSPQCGPTKMAWPLIPLGPYEAPWQR